MSLKQSIISAIANACRVDAADLHESSSLAELGLDSLTLVAVLAELEATLDFELDTNAMLTLLDSDDIGGLIERTSRLLEQKPPDSSVDARV